MSLQNKCKSLETELNNTGEQIPRDTKLIQEKRKLLERHESSKKELLEKITEIESIEYADYTNETNLLVSARDGENIEIYFIYLFRQRII